ncbi:MAG: lytic murein transglycosylase, partial [Patescibacteria group bacterium]
RENLGAQKNELELEKEDNENLKAAQQQQKQGVQSTQKEKSNLLTITKGKESEYQKILEKSKETAAQIRSRIFQLLGGGELTFEKAYEFAKLAEKATGVRAAFILAILNQESSFGRNVGQCQYNAIHPKTGVTVMRSKDIPIFEDLLSRLGIDKNSRAAYVSCPIVRDGAHGGAMGPAQFIPSTWKLYEKEIARVTGSGAPNPWNNADAFSATALYLKDSLNSSACRNYANENKHIADVQILVERCAASQYYSGGRWYTYRWVYGEPVIQKAAKFQADINVLEGS